jgi:hypothetical protein
MIPALLKSLLARIVEMIDPFTHLGIPSVKRAALLSAFSLNVKDKGRRENILLLITALRGKLLTLP